MSEGALPPRSQTMSVCAAPDSLTDRSFRVDSLQLEQHLLLPPLLAPRLFILLFLLLLPPELPPPPAVLLPLLDPLLPLLVSPPPLLKETRTDMDFISRWFSSDKESASKFCMNDAQTEWAPGPPARRQK